MLKSPTNTCALQHCRFHIAYYPDGIEGEWSDIDQDEMNSETGEFPTLSHWDDIEGEYMFEAHYDRDQDTNPDPSIELRKARAVFHESRWLHQCEGREETFIARPQDGGCRCNIWSHFVSKRWLCIPCFFVEETEAYASVQWKAGADGKLVRPTDRIHSRAHTDFVLATPVCVRKCR